MKSIFSYYEERAKTCTFFNMLLKRSGEAKQRPESLVPLEELDEIRGSPAPENRKRTQQTGTKHKVRIVERAKELRQNPAEIGKNLSQSSFWSMSVGDYRVI